MHSAQFYHPSFPIKNLTPYPPHPNMRCHSIILAYLAWPLLIYLRKMRDLQDVLQKICSLVPRTLLIRWWNLYGNMYILLNWQYQLQNGHFYISATSNDHQDEQVIIMNHYILIRYYMLLCNFSTWSTLQMVSYWKWEGKLYLLNSNVS